MQKDEIDRDDTLANAILDGEPIDWTLAESTASGDERQVLTELRFLSAIADLHRQLPPDLSDDDQDHVTPLPGKGAHWGRLRLIDKLGAGTFGTVYRAWDPRLQREVAIKMLTLPADAGDEFAADIIHEGRLLARVRHPSVVTIYDAEQIGNVVGLCMELVPGRTLEAHLRRNGAVPPDETVRVGLALCDALSAVHGAGLLHRDVKASNVMIGDDRRIVLMDFGTGRDLESAGGFGDNTGTPMYLAPEVLEGHAATVRSDVYSLGVLLYRAVTGAYPIEAQSLADLRLAHQLRRADPSHTVRTARPDIPARLAGVLDCAMNSRPERRFASAAEMAKALAPGEAAPGYRRAFVQIAAVGLVLVAMTAAAWSFARGRTPDAAVRPMRIAVLPFSLDGGGDDNEMLRDGITEDVSARLARFDNVRVISKASAHSVGMMKLTIQEIGARLGVDAIVTGRLSVSDGSMTVATKVIRAADARELWTAEFVRPSAGRLALQRDLADAIADTLDLRSDNAMKWPTRSPRAYALYIRGRSAFDSFTREGRQQALRLYEEALTIDPDFALAHAGAAEVYLVRPLAIPHIDGQEALQRGTELAARALTLDGMLPEAHLASAAVSSARAEWDAAERSFKKAIDLNPSNVLGHQQYSLWLSLQGRFDASIEEARAAYSLDPLSPRAVMSIASALRFARRYDEALTYNRQALELDPAFGPAFHNTGLCLQGLGRLDEAIDAYRKIGVPTGNLGHALAVAGRTSEAREMLDVFMRLQEETNRGTGEIAQILIGLGEYEQALDWIERTERLEPGGPSTFKVAAVWDPLRTNPRFVALLKKWKLDR